MSKPRFVSMDYNPKGLDGPVVGDVPNQPAKKDPLKGDFIDTRVPGENPFGIAISDVNIGKKAKKTNPLSTQVTPGLWKTEGY